MQGILYFRSSADYVDNPGGQVTTYRQVKGSPSLLRATAITLWQPSLLTRGRRWGLTPGFRVSFRFRLVGMWDVAAGDTRGNLTFTGLGLFG